MHVTFNNRFELVGTPNNNVRIHYRHNLRCNLKMFIQKNGDVPPARDWDIVMEGGSKILIEEFKPRLTADMARYLKRRIKKSPLQVYFKDFETLAAVRSIN